jgi:hypothetical protein
MAPVRLFKLNPNEANEPEVTLHVNGPVPPDTLRVAL